MSPRAIAALLLATAALAGCGEKPEPDVTKTTAVTGTVDLARSGPRTPATAATPRSSLAFSGRVRPASARVTLTPAGRAAGTVRVAGDGAFRVRARKLTRGRNRFLLKGTAPGLRAWTLDVAITRR